jgi:hypothetical protein
MRPTQPRSSFARTVLTLALVGAAGISACRVPKELDPVAALPHTAEIARETLRPSIAVAVDESLDSNVLPEDLMAAGTSSRDPRPIDRLRRTIMEGMRTTRHFRVMEEEEKPDYVLKFTVSEITVDDEEELGCIDWFNYKFFGLYLTATVRVGATLYSGDTREPVGANIEQFGRYQLLEGKAFRSYRDEYVNLLGMGTGFTKGGRPAVANALQKAIVRLIHDVANATEQKADAPTARIKEAE